MTVNIIIKEIINMKITDAGLKCPINYRDGYAVHYLSEQDAYKIYMYVPFLENHANVIGTYIYDNRDNLLIVYRREE